MKLNPLKQKMEIPKIYFGKNVDDAINRYNQSQNRFERELIFVKEIYPAFNRLSENIVFKYLLGNYGIQTFAELVHELNIHLYERLEKFKPDRKKRAFSYFNRIAINFCNAKKLDNLKHSVVGGMVNIDMNRDIVNEVQLTDNKEEIEDFTQQWAEWGLENINKIFYKKRDRQIAEAIFNLFRNCKLIENYNRKALYIMIREQVDVKTQYITDTLKIIKPLYYEMLSEYKLNGTDYWDDFLINKSLNNEIIDMFDNY